MRRVRLLEGYAGQLLVTHLMQKMQQLISPNIKAMERHLIDDGWIMRADDEALHHDCQTWWRLDSNPSGKWMIGAPYARGLFVPIRRNGPRPPNEIERLLFLPNTELTGANRTEK